MHTRRYPRTLDEAFPRSADYACAVERPRPSIAPGIAWCALIVIFVLLLIHAAARIFGA